MVRAAARLYGDENRRKPLEVAYHLGSPKLAPDDHHLILINTVKLEHRLGGIHAIRTGIFIRPSSHLSVTPSAIKPWG
jgi:hypothetical protein